jgi:hypothetical protein
VISKSKERETKSINENIIALRSAIFNENGTDKNVCEGISSSLMKYERNGIDVSIEFSSKLILKETDWAFDLVKENMEDVYDNSGYGWDDDDKYRELTEKGTRFLCIREWPVDDNEKGELVGFVHFRFTVQGIILLNVIYFVFAT